METWKTRMRLAFPTFPQGLLPDPQTAGPGVKGEPQRKAACRPLHCPEPETFTPQFLVVATPQF
jgi:hypothetical protein